MKDKLIWFACLLLFLAGVVWSKLSFPSDFYKVENIHDLFDMMGGAQRLPLYRSHMLD